jgi:hypothetical protein
MQVTSNIITEATWNGTPIDPVYIASAGGIYNLAIIALSGTTQSLDLENNGAYYITLNNNCVFSFSLSPPAGMILYERIIILKQDASGGHMITLPSSVVWCGTASPTTPPVLGTGPITFAIIRLKNYDGGITWYGSVEGSTGNGGGNIPVIGVYFVGGTNEICNVSTDGVTFTSAAVLGFLATADILDIVYNPAYTMFYALGKSPSGSGASPVDYIRYTTNGSSWTSPSTGNSASISDNSANKIHVFSNGNMITSQPPSSTLDNIAFSSNGGVNWNAPLSLAGNQSFNSGWIGVANDALLCLTTSTTFYYTTNGLTILSGSHPNSYTGGVYLNGNYILGDAASAFCAYKTLVSSSTVTSISSALSSAAFIGGAYDGVGYILFNAISLSSSTSISSSFTSQTTAFFTTAGMTGSIVQMASNGMGTIVAVTDSGDVGYTNNQGANWSKLSPTSNPLNGIQIRGIKYNDSSFWIFGDAGNLAYSNSGVFFSPVVTSGFGANAAISFVGA